MRSQKVLKQKGVCKGFDNNLEVAADLLHRDAYMTRQIPRFSSLPLVPLIAKPSFPEDSSAVPF